MPENEDAEAEILRQFQQGLSDLDPADLRDLLTSLTMMGGPALPRGERTELRRPPLDELATFRVRVDLNHARPPIWRRLDLRSDLTLDVVHQILQAAFGWTDSHLHRFSLGGHPFDRTSQSFLCPYDVDEGEFEDADGIPASAVRLEEALQQRGDVLNYLYDYGDNWELTLRLEELLPATPDQPSAVAVAGRRAAPPDDSGGGTDLASIALVVDDPEHFDLDELNQELRAPYFVLRELGIDERLVDLVNRLRFTAVGDDLAQHVVALTIDQTGPDPEMLATALAAHQWFLDRAADDGIPLTSAGYLKPDDVVAASAVVPAMGSWIGTNNREAHSIPLLHFRESLQVMGLLRKYRGRLLLTRAGAAAQRDPAKLWAHLAGRLIPTKGDEFATVSTLVLLAYAAGSPNEPIPHQKVTEVLTGLGWRRNDSRPLQGYEVIHLDAVTTLVNLTDVPTQSGDRLWLSPAAAALARDALRPSAR